MTQPHAQTASLDPPSGLTARYRVVGMDCSSCASKIESAVRLLPGVAQVKVSIASQIMTVSLADAAQLDAVETTVRALGYQLSRADLPEISGDDDDLPQDLAQVSPGYRRALWIVVLLNAGYGVIEIGGGYLTGSQALKADALDFLGDGLITFLGLLAIGWSLVWRARAALIQGMFLGVLGLGVLGETLYRIAAHEPPEALMMGAFGLVALAVNVTAAMVLIPHRTGDSNMRAVWLFSRNDAIGNAAVVAAAGLVLWTDTVWPDLVVALLIAGLFLHSSWSIIRHARGDLAEAGAKRASHPAWMARLQGGAAILVVAVMDQLTKAFALFSPLAAQNTEILPFFNLVLVRNPGVTFGALGQGGVPWWALFLLALGIVATLSVWLWRETNRLVGLGLGLIIGGAVGNMIDRWRHGAVTDFIDLHAGTWHWPSFNLADAAIAGGAALLIVHSLVQGRKARGGRP